MESFHYKNGQCENCGLAVEKVGRLQIINFWQHRNSQLIPYYLYVCSNCFESRNLWCKNIYPDNCQKCNDIIEDGEHYLEKTVNHKGQNIESYGIAHNEKCRIICLECHQSNN